jgi:hypothetical protein
MLSVGSDPSWAEKHDFELGEIIAEFALKLESKGWPSNILQIVASEPDDILAYFNPERSLQVYAQT